MSGGGVVDLPQYIKNGDFLQQEIYFELMNLILTQWFNSNGFFQPSLTSDQVEELLNLPQPPGPGVHWLNTDLNKMQFIDATNVVQTITST